jgi:hypothetical protein
VYFYSKIILLNDFALVLVQYLFLGILFLALVTFSLAISIFLTLINKNKVFKSRRSIINKLEDWITEIILQPEKGEDFTLPPDIKKILQNPLAKKVLLREIMKLKRSLSGTSARNLDMLYHHLKLYRISTKRIAGNKWHVKAKGIQELAMMNKQNLHTIVSAYTHNKDFTVRMEAQTALVRLQGFKALYFFETLTYPLSEWHQLNLLHLLSSQSLPNKNDVIRWLHSSNSSVVQFILKLITEQHAEEFYNEVVNCLRHKSEVVRLEAIRYLGQIPSFDTNTLLKNQYIIEPDKNIRLCIIKLLERNESPDNILFVQNLQLSSDADVKLAADSTVLYLQKKISTGQLAASA